MRFLTLRRDLVCREAVELVTDYLEGRMARRDANKGLATLCIGGGMGIALTVER